MKRAILMLTLLTLGSMMTSCGTKPADPFNRYIDPGLSDPETTLLKSVNADRWSDEYATIDVAADVDTDMIAVSRSDYRGTFIVDNHNIDPVPMPYYASIPSIPGSGSATLNGQALTYLPKCTAYPSTTGLYYRELKYGPRMVGMRVTLPDASSVAVQPGVGDSPHIYLGGWGWTPNQRGTGIDAGIAYKSDPSASGGGYWTPFMRVENWSQPGTDAGYVAPGAEVKEVKIDGQQWNKFFMHPSDTVYLRFRAFQNPDRSTVAKLMIRNETTNQSVTISLIRKESSGGRWLKDWNPELGTLTMKRMVSIGQNQSPPYGQAYVPRDSNLEYMFNADLRDFENSYSSDQSGTRYGQDFTQCRFPLQTFVSSDKPQAVNMDLTNGVESISIFPWTNSILSASVR